MAPHALAAPAEGGTYVWVDARGLPARRVAREVLARARAAGFADARAGAARVAVAAEVAARLGAGRDAGAGGRPAAPLTGVAPGAEAAFLAPHPVAALAESAGAGAAGGDEAARPSRGALARAAAALADVGVLTCGALAAVAREAVEVRLGAAGVALWRLARADDPRRVFRHGGGPLPAASMEWSEFDLRDPERLVFVAARLADQVCGALDARGEGAGAMTLLVRLSGGGAVERRVRAARDTADPAAWRRLLRAELERVELPDAVCGLALRVEAARAAGAPQADLFDRGGQTAGAAAAALARLVEDGAGRPVRPVTGAHPLPERRLAWEVTTVDAAMQADARARRAPPAAPTAPARIAVPTAPATAVREGPRLTLYRAGAAPEAPAAPAGEPLHLRVLPRARPLAVTARAERGHVVPVRYRERLGEGERAPRGVPLVEVLTAAGPDRVTAGAEHGETTAREYWQCLTERGDLVLLYRDAAAAEEGGAWFLHGWWD